MKLTAHLAHWPPGQAHGLTVPAPPVHRNLEVTALRYPDRAATIFYDSALGYAALHDQVERLAGFLQHECGVGRGDRVLLQLQNSPQWIAAFFAILRADAVVVPVSPMMVTEELRYFAADSGAKVAIAAQDLAPRLLPLLDAGALRGLVVATYSDALGAATELEVPEVVRAPRDVPARPGVFAWKDALASMVGMSTSSHDVVAGCGRRPN